MWFLEPPWCNKKVDPEKNDSYGSYELLINNVALQINEKLMKDKFIYFYFSVISFIKKNQELKTTRKNYSKEKM